MPVTSSRGKFSVGLLQWLPLLEKTLALWLEGDRERREILAVTEMGPVSSGYNLAQLPKSWDDAKVLRQVIDKAWKKALSACYEKIQERRYVKTG